MDLDALVDSLKNFEGVTRKKPIREITNILKDVYNVAGNTVLNFGDDASAIDIGDGKLLLLAADGIWGKLMTADPYWAGYCSVLVNVNDIAAMGGKPMGMVNVLSVNDEESCYAVMEGIKDGARKFGVPMVGGHVHPDTPYDALDVSISGIVPKNALITSCDAQVGDQVIVAIDLDGRQHPKFALNWDTTTHKKPSLVQAQIDVMGKIGAQKLVTAGKDISNPGTLGTLGMLLESSGVGAEVELNKIPRNESVSWDEWLKSYPGSGFVLTCKPSTVDRCLELLKEVSITGAVVGEIIADEKLYLEHEDQKRVLFDLKTNGIMGVREEKSN
ncbi:MAG: methanogenesis marker 2 protein [Methanobacteriales archaeon HGW-Methanobacteriales-1]|nr:MAG: methanogenesis marker 2 protein [Methanobacteriales archaeon HGW-Methanobacteriales-1]